MKKRFALLALGLNRRICFWLARANRSRFLWDPIRCRRPHNHHTTTPGWSFPEKPRCVSFRRRKVVSGISLMDSVAEALHLLDHVEPTPPEVHARCIQRLEHDDGLVIRREQIPGSFKGFVFGALHVNLDKVDSFDFVLLDIIVQGDAGYFYGLRGFIALAFLETTLGLIPWTRHEKLHLSASPGHGPPGNLDVSNLCQPDVLIQEVEDILVDLEGVNHPCRAHPSRHQECVVTDIRPDVEGCHTWAEEGQKKGGQLRLVATLTEDPPADLIADPDEERVT